VARCSAFEDEQLLLVVRIAEESHASAADCDALAEGGEAEWLELPLRSLRDDDISGMGARYRRDERGQSIRRSGRSNRMGSVADRQDMRVRNRPQVGIDPDPSLRVRRKASGAGDRRRA